MSRSTKDLWARFKIVLTVVSVESQLEFLPVLCNLLYFGYFEAFSKIKLILSNVRNFMRRINGFSFSFFCSPRFCGGSERRLSKTQIKWLIQSTAEYLHSFEIRLISVAIFLSFCLSICLSHSLLFLSSILLIHFRFENDAGNLKKWQHFRRELVNLSTLFVPWQLRIKEIESHFGSVVASYFTFLRWLFWVNIVLAFTLSTFVILPEVGMKFYFYFFLLLLL